MLAPAIEIAERGYRLSPNSIAWATGYLDEILASSYLRFVVLNGGDRLGSAGDLMCRPDLACNICDASQKRDQAPSIAGIRRAQNGHLTSPRSEVSYSQWISRPCGQGRLQPLQSHYRGAEVLSYPWPGGGGEVAEALNILQTFSREISSAKTRSDRLHVMVETFRIAHDRLPPFRSGSDGTVDGDVLSHLSESHARAARRTHHPRPRHFRRRARSRLKTTPRMGEHTTHVSVADRWGNAVSLTQTLCRQYGAKIATPGLGFPYNSCLEFFDYEHPESPLFLRPRRRYMSTMAPTIVRGGWRTDDSR